MRIKPFNALRPTREHASRVACAAYDTLDRSEAFRLAHDNPFSMLHVTRAEIDFDEDHNPYDDSVYKKASENFARLQNEGIINLEDAPSLYLYRITARRHVQTGIMACCHVEDYKTNKIKRHEKTRSEKLVDRAKLASTIRAHIGPVLLTHRPLPELKARANEESRQQPLYEITAPDGSAHTVWRVRETQAFIEAFEGAAAYIADGHHRAAAALQVAEEDGFSQGEQRESSWFPALLFPSDQLRILPYNRSVRDLNGLEKEAFLKRLRTEFGLAPGLPRPKRRGLISMYFDGQWFSLDCAAAGAGLASSVLDVDHLQTRLLAPVLGIHNPTADSRIEYIGGDRSVERLEELVDSGQFAVSFSMFPVDIEQVLAVADACGTMPPKSTWFDPKPLSGLLMYSF